MKEDLQEEQKLIENHKDIQNLELEDLIKYSKTVRVLYVESDNYFRENSFGVFKVFFHRIDTARDGQEGFEYFKNNKYDLIITSIDMPNMTGVEMITKIREISKNITILITSSDTNNFIDLIRLGIDGYILKPVEVKQFTSIIQKVIEKLENKQKIYEYKNYLEQKVNEKTKELEIFNTNLEQRVKDEIAKNKDKDKLIIEQTKMASLGEMIGNIAHQWRQPLSVISIGATGLKLQSEHGLLTDQLLNKTCDSINDNAQYLSKTIDDFKCFIKGDRKFKQFNLKNIFDNFISIVDSSIKNYDINLILDLNEEIIMNGYENELIQCFINIFNNSVDALNDTKTEDSMVFISIKKVDSNALIIFKDNAGGISDDIIKKIFDPYFTTKHKSQGTGLGLNITYRLIVDGMNGTIEVNNQNFIYNKEKHNGAEFTISLPI
ncbi:MAG: hybrid sensor histidine kinase/response regulator [Campylobacterota bacterium]|nr:hybrid sensor histidine kinase/response regulator [Campylobacterota bacterium]